MKLKLSIFISLFAFILFSSCSKNEKFDDSWKLENEAQFAKIASNSEYTKLNSSSNKGFVMYKIIESGDGDESPNFTDYVKIRYTGWFKRIWQNSDTYKNEQGDIITNKIVFDSTPNSSIPSTFNLNPNNPFGLIDGLSTALQHMKIGDIWEVWIPSKLGYGSIVKGSIPAYTTLVFEVELVEIVE